MIASMGFKVNEFQNIKVLKSKWKYKFSHTWELFQYMRHIRYVDRWKKWLQRERVMYITFFIDPHRMDKSQLFISNR